MVFSSSSSGGPSRSCEVINNGQCFTTNTRGEYDNDDFCYFDLIGEGTLEIPRWSLADTSDNLELVFSDDTSLTFTSDTGPPLDGFVTDPRRTAFYFSSDSAGTAGGIVVCACAPVVTDPPTPAPTPSPTIFVPPVSCPAVSLPEKWNIAVWENSPNPCDYNLRVRRLRCNLRAQAVPATS